MSGTFPSTPKFESVNFKINTPGLVTKTMSGKSRRVNQGHSFYSFTAKYPSITRGDLGTITGFMSQQLGSQYSFQIVLPEISYTKLATQVASATVSGGTDALGGGIFGYLAGKTQLTVTVPATGNVLKAGDFFKFNHASTPTTSLTKVYMCATSLVVSSGTTGTLAFSGGLVDNIPNGTALTITAVPFTVILENTNQFEVGLGGISSLSIEMTEVW
jgi:hypothetical protein